MLLIAAAPKTSSFSPPIQLLAGDNLETKEV